LTALEKFASSYRVGFDSGTTCNVVRNTDISYPAGYVWIVMNVISQ